MRAAPHPGTGSHSQWIGHGPARGGSNLRQIKKLKRVDAVEWLHALLIPAGVIVGYLVMTVVTVSVGMFVYDYALMDTLQFLKKVIGGAPWKCIQT